MGHQILEDFVAGHQEDIQAADDCIMEYVLKPGQNSNHHSMRVIVDWFIRIDIVALRDRAQIIKRLADAYGPYSRIFGTDHYDDALDHWKGTGADAFADYCKGGSEGNDSLLVYCNDVHQGCIDHYHALNELNGAGGFIEVLEGFQNHFAEVFVSQIDGFKQRYDDAIGLTISFDPLDACIQNILNIYKGISQQADLATGASKAVAQLTDFMSNGSAANLDEGSLGPRRTVPLDNLDPVEGDWTGR